MEFISPNVSVVKQRKKAEKPLAAAAIPKAPDEIPVLLMA